MDVMLLDLGDGLFVEVEGSKSGVSGHGSERARTMASTTSASKEVAHFAASRFSRTLAKLSRVLINDMLDENPSVGEVSVEFAAKFNASVQAPLRLIDLSGGGNVKVRIKWSSKA